MAIPNSVEFFFFFLVRPKLWQLHFDILLSPLPFLTMKTADLLQYFYFSVTDGVLKRVNITSVLALCAYYISLSSKNVQIFNNIMINDSCHIDYMWQVMNVMPNIRQVWLMI